MQRHDGVGVGECMKWTLGRRIICKLYMRENMVHRSATAQWAVADRCTMRRPGRHALARVRANAFQISSRLLHHRRLCLYSPVRSEKNIPLNSIDVELSLSLCVRGLKYDGIKDVLF